MILPDKLHNYDISLTKLDKLCSSNELELEIIKRYNIYLAIEQQTRFQITRINELEQDILNKLQSIDSQHSQITDLEQENKELKAEINSLSRDSLGNMQDAIKAEQQYNKLRDAIKEVITHPNKYTPSQVFISDIQSILDSVENEK